MRCATTEWLCLRHRSMSAYEELWMMRNRNCLECKILVFMWFIGVALRCKSKCAIFQFMIIVGLESWIVFNIKFVSFLTRSLLTFWTLFDRSQRWIIHSSWLIIHPWYHILNLLESRTLRTRRAVINLQWELCFWCDWWTLRMSMTVGRSQYISCSFVALAFRRMNGGWRSKTDFESARWPIHWWVQ